MGESNTKPTNQINEDLFQKESLSAIHIVDSLIASACLSGASDIHIDPVHDSVVVRFRVDGQLIQARILSKSSHHEFIARLKILSGLRTDEHHAAQDGRFPAKSDTGSRIDIRVSIAPTFYGENAVLRLLPESRTHRDLASLHFSPLHEQRIRTALTYRSGLILVTGPTGSGKTTTLYALMMALAKESLSLVTIEDPIEYAMEGVSQIPANPRTGLSFAEGLRSILRQDPDVIMVGEIRDEETAALAVNAALTGHLVLSTLHTNDAATVFPRLLDLEVQPFLAASTVRLIIAQRLVRRKCLACTSKNNEMVGVCESCGGTKLKGRIGIYELIVVSEEIEDAVMARRTARDIALIARKEGYGNLYDDALAKQSIGLISNEETSSISYA